MIDSTSDNYYQNLLQRHIEIILQYAKQANRITGFNATVIRTKNI